MTVYDPDNYFSIFYYGKSPVYYHFGPMFAFCQPIVQQIEDLPRTAVTCAVLVKACATVQKGRRSEETLRSGLLWRRGCKFVVVFPKLGGGFKYFLCSSQFGEDSNFD